VNNQTRNADAITIEWAKQSILDTPHIWKNENTTSEPESLHKNKHQSIQSEKLTTK